jgi:exonuclease SbcD
LSLSIFKFIHAADVHLDSPLRGLARYEGFPADRIRLATREALAKLVDIAIDAEVSFIIIAGDLYDGEWDDFETGLYFCGQLRRLNDAGIRVYIGFGNHDAASVQTKRLPLPPNVRAFRSRSPETLLDEATGAILHGQSYKDRDPGDLLPNYPGRREGGINIGVLHTALTGRPPHDPYAPCTVEQLRAKGYDYWALGHVHAFEMVSNDPYIVFPGNLQGRHIREVGPKGAVLVTVVEHEITHVERVTTDVVRWSHLNIEATGCADRPTILNRVREGFVELQRANVEDLPYAVRVSLIGQTDLHGELLQYSDVMREEVRAVAAGITDNLWIEKFEIKTKAPPVIDRADTDDVSAALSVIRGDTDFQIAFASGLMAFFGKIPEDIVRESLLLSAARTGSFGDLFQDAEASLNARLRSEAI